LWLTFVFLGYVYDTDGGKGESCVHRMTALISRVCTEKGTDMRVPSCVLAVLSTLERTETCGDLPWISGRFLCTRESGDMIMLTWCLRVFHI
jgi:hypothetical protein